MGRLIFYQTYSIGCKQGIIVNLVEPMREGNHSTELHVIMGRGEMLDALIECWENDGT